MWHNDMYPVIHFGLTSILLPALFDVRPCKLAPEKIMTRNFNVFPTQKIQKRLIFTSLSPF